MNLTECVEARAAPSGPVARRARVRRTRGGGAAAALARGVIVLTPAAVHAQQLEPRAYSNAPVGLNFFVAGYGHSEGGLSTDPSLPLQDARLRVHSGVLAYARAIDLWGRSGKFDLILPLSQLSGTALVAGLPIERHVSGFGDPRLRLSVNFYGAPALDLPRFAAYQQDLVVGGSVQVSAPAGQYDPSKAVNLGSNRWSIKPDIGFSKALGRLTLDMTAAVAILGSNDDFFGGQTRKQAPIYSVQSNISTNFSGGIWAALGATFYSGGRTTVDGVRKDDALSNSRYGLTVALPLNRNDSIKLDASSGISTRTGTSFDTLGMAWQHRWGAGL